MAFNIFIITQISSSLVSGINIRKKTVYKSACIMYILLLINLELEETIVTLPHEISISSLYYNKFLITNMGNFACK